MKKYLIPPTGNFYKANLHCHSTVSDGSLTPEELKEVYKAEGYSVLAYTDHDVLIAHPELADENFLPLNGFEVEINEDRDTIWPNIRTCHLCMIALEPDNLIQPCWHRSKYATIGNAAKYAPLVKFDETQPDYERSYTPECVSEVMQRGKDAGFFITYNHPAWSLEEFPQYVNYHNMHAMEISNTSCLVSGYDDYSFRVYDDMLRHGEKIFAVSADDNHNAFPNTGNWDSCGGWVMIKADKLEYRAITKALEEGNFYASQGPVIRNVWFEDGEIHVECDPAESIKFYYGNREGKAVFADGKTLTHASAKVADHNIYVRITVTDEKGRPANTSAYFVEDLLNED